jgi:hypothetical protein
LRHHGSLTAVLKAGRFALWLARLV